MVTGAVSYDELRDLQTGTKMQPSVTPSNLPQALTSNGSVLGLQGGSLVLWNSQGLRSIVTAEAAQSAIINDAGTQVIYQTSFCYTYSTCRVRAVDLSTGADTLIGNSVSPMQPSISNDGTLVVYLAQSQASEPRQAWLVRPDGSGREQLTRFPEEVDEAELDGLGTAVIAVSGGRLVSIDTQSGAAQELIGRTPTCYLGSVSLIPGSILPIRGTWLAPSAQVASVPLPTALAGVRVLMDGTPLPILSVSPGEVWFQVPFELAPGPMVSVGLEHSSLFEGCPAARVPIVARQPYFLAVAHQDFGSLVTFSAPVHPGEIVHAYAVGLGAVAPQLQTGMPASSGQLYKLADPFDCFVGYNLDGPQLDVAFAGLAPGFIGIYQVDVRMPSPLPPQDFFLNCGTPDNVYERHGVFVTVPR